MLRCVAQIISTVQEWLNSSYSFLCSKWLHGSNNNDHFIHSQCDQMFYVKHYLIHFEEILIQKNHTRIRINAHFFILPFLLCLWYPQYSDSCSAFLLRLERSSSLLNIFLVFRDKEEKLIQLTGREKGPWEFFLVLRLAELDSFLILSSSGLKYINYAGFLHHKVIIVFPKKRMMSQNDVKS